MRVNLHKTNVIWTGSSIKIDYDGKFPCTVCDKLIDPLWDLQKIGT